MVTANDSHFCDGPTNAFILFFFLPLFFHPISSLLFFTVFSIRLAIHVFEYKECFFGGHATGKKRKTI